MKIVIDWFGMLTCAALLTACGGATSSSDTAREAVAGAEPSAPSSPAQQPPNQDSKVAAPAVPCAATAALSLASGEGIPSAIEVDDTRTYWLTHAGAGANGGVKLRAVDKCGGPVVTLATGPYFSEGLTQDATTLYFATSIGSGQGAILSVAKTGGPATTLFQGNGRPSGIAADDTSVYWADSIEHVVYTLSKSGGTPVRLASALAPKGLSSPTSVAVKGADVYAAGQEGVWKIPIAGGAPVLVFAEPVEALRATEDYLVLASGYGIFSLHLPDGATKRLADGGNSVCAGATDIAYASYDTGELVDIHRVPFLGGADDVVVASGTKGPGVVACDATAAYWAGGGQITRSSLLH